jgi:hypothetical protein
LSGCHCHHTGKIWEGYRSRYDFASGVSWRTSWERLVAFILASQAECTGQKQKKYSLSTRATRGFNVSVLSRPISEYVTNIDRSWLLVGHNGAWIGLRPARVAQNTLKTMKVPWIRYEHTMETRFWAGGGGTPSGARTGRGPFRELRFFNRKRPSGIALFL